LFFKKYFPYAIDSVAEPEPVERQLFAGAQGFFGLAPEPLL
jgi:hypothetical protein